MKLSQDQKSAIKTILNWVKNPGKKNYISLGGYAGTGKTTLTAVLRQILHKNNPDLKVALISYTGKASRVLQTTLKKHKASYPQDFVGTIHSYIYAPLTNQKGEILGWDKKQDIDARIIIVDEASMVNRLIWKDLTSFDVPIIAIGDHGQLPPIEGDFNLMQDPNIRLENIHRQAKNNPIIKLSIQARKTGYIEPGKYGEQVQKIAQSDFDSEARIKDLLRQYDEDTLVLSGYNYTRVKINEFIRQEKFFEPTEEPNPGDRVICLKNNHKKNIYNGMLGTILALDPQGEDHYHTEIEMDANEDIYQGKIYRPQFGAKKTLSYTDEKEKIDKEADLFDFGYALTVHKAQGSQARRVILFEERFRQMDDQEWRRWLYTGVTRAEEDLYILGS